MYTPQVYEYHLQNHVLQGLIKQSLPDLWNQMTRKLQMSFDMLTTQWLMTMFVGFINDRTFVLPILDNFILEKNPKCSATPLASWRVIYGYIICFLHKH